MLLQEFKPVQGGFDVYLTIASHVTGNFRDSVGESETGLDLE